MQTERKYGFRQVLNTIHRPDRRDVAASPRPDELEITGGWRIILTCGNAPLPEKVARDLQDYFFTSMNVSLLLEKKNAPSDRNDPKCLLLGTKTEFPILGCELTVPGSYILEVTADRIVLCGCDARGLAQGCFYLEDLMNLREAPFLPTGRQRREPLFSPRMVHSGWGIDQFPDAHLNAIAHAGMDAILVFAKDVDTTTVGYLDFNDLIERAAGFGLDVYLYSYLKSRKHPGEKDAREYYDSTYGKLFKACPDAKGVILVGESCEFPSRDTVNTTGRLWEPSRDGIRAEKPSPGWWPCFDYPEWLAMIRDTVRRYNPDADIVFWTYNWGYAPETERLRLIESLPTDITLMATFEMFEPLRRDHATGVCTDYTISFAGPGRYFAGEAAAAAKHNIRLYTMSNTAGRTWDFGTVPFIPVPFQWGVRHRALRKARCDWGLSGLMESHHYGFSPSCVSELAKWNFWSPEVPEDEIMTRIAIRDFGVAGAVPALAAWRLWSEAITLFTPTNEDMYGPCRVGPSYPMIFHPDITRTFESQEIAMPSVPHAHFGHRIVMTFYRPFENEQQSPGGVRFPGEIAALEKMLELWREGNRLMEQAAELAPPSKHPEALRMAGLGRYIAHNLVTAIHMKKWWLLNKRLLLESNLGRAIGLLGEIETLARAEIANAAATIPLVEADSRLGWEPSMEYMTDREHLEWKIRQVQTVLDVAIPAYKKMLRLGATPDETSSQPAVRKGN